MLHYHKVRLTLMLIIQHYNLLIIIQ
ncbi:hypothetical protein PP915_gp23 [Staphylococcus phage JPL-50]|uniref:Uncharacterized protein n=1 Tax=Staphylococcus phage JPL-50 TaxID=2851077 RepID=A0A8F3HNN0_9CAUD|nr:hypothetical protein PP915_gp23 [Staphylococcus phage JPL-50]QWY14504.1 hypothetical protein [Staphylococcus phage JPL-50]